MEKNDSYVEGIQNEPFFIPTVDLGQHLIEEAIIIDANFIKPLKELEYV